ncbi:MAG TPA: hypothetical protein VEV39_00530 [Gemmatimonadales bacterium]|nr:hypothetical protein [Gemmatimonadales bacterium]
MTETARRVARLAAPHARGRAFAALIVAAGLALVAAALGVLLAPNVWGVTLGWALVAGAGVVAWRIWRQESRTLGDHHVGRLVEQLGRGRSGSVVNVLHSRTASGEGLWGAADARAAAQVARATDDVAGHLNRRTRRFYYMGLGTVAGGAGLLLLAQPTSARAAAFWHPLRTIADAHSPVRLVLDRTVAHRGDTVTATIIVKGGTAARFWTRAPGEPWSEATVILDSNGTAHRALGPLTSDVFVRVTSGSRTSPTLAVHIPPLAFVGAVTVTAHYPKYLSRPDETLPLGADTAVIPEGTVLSTEGEASVPIASARWSPGSPLDVHSAQFKGSFRPTRGGRFALIIAPADGSPVEGEPPILTIKVAPDSAPVVALNLPTADTTLPPTLHQPVVVDAHDDHALTRVALQSWRASQTGKVGDTLSQPLSLDAATDRAILQADLDATARGLFPGDTLKLRVVAWDNAPQAHEGHSATIALRLPTLAELRAATRAATQELGSSTDSVLNAAKNLGAETRDLAAERTRAGTTQRTGSEQPGTDPKAGAMPFESSQRAQELARRQEALSQKVQDLSHAVQELAQAAHAAGIDDSAFQRRLADVQQLLQKAITPELEQRLRELQDALQRLDPEATRQALQHLSEAQEELKDALQRSDQLFRRAAVEGQLATLTQDAEELKRRQGDWNSTQAPQADSAAAAQERELAAGTDSLMKGIQQAGQDLRAGQTLGQPMQSAQQARQAMGKAGDAASQGNPGDAKQQGQRAEEALKDLPDQLRSRRDSLSGAWRQETLDALDRAMSETADLARRQQQIADQLSQGQSGAPMRSSQASVEEGAQAVAQQMQETAGKNALVSPQLAAAMALARRQMAQARQQLEQARPNTQSASQFAAQAVDALNATALGISEARAQVNGSKSGSGLSEALEQLSKMAGQQQGLNGESQGILPMMGTGGAVNEQLRALAARQRALADQLQRLQASGNAPGAGSMADEAKEIARRMEAGQLDPVTVARQQALYHHLLDAGRSLTGNEPDDQRERRAPLAGTVNPLLPPAIRPGATGLGPRVPYPTWESLRDLTPDQRQQVLQYFRLLNAPAPVPAHTGP